MAEEVSIGMLYKSPVVACTLLREIMKDTAWEVREKALRGFLRVRSEIDAKLRAETIADIEALLKQEKNSHVCEAAKDAIWSLKLTAK